ncbi:MAG: IPT/TIG domain-containing protein, partial [Planctomycetes bacterium]|nr:IPT/TIG domain-containing protein [Planctomycetota bacterium]
MNASRPLSILLLAVFSAASSPEACGQPAPVPELETPGGSLYVDCGGTQELVDEGGRLWKPDAPYLAPGHPPTKTPVYPDETVDTSLLGPEVPNAALTSERSREGWIHYQIAAPKDEYKVTLYFSENCKPCVSAKLGGTSARPDAARFFDLVVEGQRVTDYNPADAAQEPPGDGVGATFKATRLAFQVGVGDGALDIQLIDKGATNPPGDPFIQAMAVHRQPGVPALTRISEVQPSLVSTLGGTAVTFVGEAFAQGDVARIGSLELATQEPIREATAIRGTTPRLPAGLHAADVVREGKVVASLPDACEAAPPPELTRVDPSEIPRDGGIAVLVVGKYLRGETVIKFGDHALVNPVWDPRFQGGARGGVSVISGKAPPLSSGERLGPKDVVAEDSRGRSVLPGGVNYVERSVRILVVDPWLFAPRTRSEVRIFGELFVQDMLVKIFDMIGDPEQYDLVDPEFVNSGLIRGKTPYLEMGWYGVRIEQEGRIVASLGDAIEVAPPPELTSVEPAQVSADGSTRVTVTGRYFRSPTVIRIGSRALVDPILPTKDGTVIGGFAPPLLPGEVPGPRDVVAEDSRGQAVLPAGVTYVSSAPALPGPQQMEASLAEGTARFSWHNPISYRQIRVLDETGTLARSLTLPGDATFLEVPAPKGGDQVHLIFQGEGDGGNLSSLTPAFAARHDCQRPPPLTGEGVTGVLELAVYGGHPEASEVGCGAGGPGDDLSLCRDPGSGARGLGGIGRVTSALTLSACPTAGKVTTGFVLQEPARKLEIRAYYEKVAAEFGVSLRGRLTHVYPDDGFVDELTFPDTIVGCRGFRCSTKDWHTALYFRADRDPSDPEAVPCDLEIPAGEYLLDIYAVGGERDLPYYLFADDGRPNELLIPGAPCPPYPLVEVRDLSGFPTLPQISAITGTLGTGAFGPVESVPGATLTAEGFWLDAAENHWSINPDCKPDPKTGLCEPPYRNNPDFEYEWKIYDDSIPRTVLSSSNSVFVIGLSPGCYVVDITVRAVSCDLSVTYTREVPILPETVTCETDRLEFLHPQPDLEGIHAIAGLDPPPGDGTFEGEREIRFTVLAVPPCACDSIDPEDCPAASLGEPGEGLGPDFELRLALKSESGEGYHHLALAHLRDDCKDVVNGPKYFSAWIADLGAINPTLLPQRDFAEVQFQARTRALRTPVTGEREPVTDTWTNVGSPFFMTARPEVLEESYWTGSFDPADASYHFVVKSSSEAAVEVALPASNPVPLDILEAGASIPSYQNSLRSGFVSRFRLERDGDWKPENGTGVSLGEILGNRMTGAAVNAAPLPSSEGSGGGVDVEFPTYEWCKSQVVLDSRISQELFRGIIYTGTVGPVPVTIWGQLDFDLEARAEYLIQARLSPFAPLEGETSSVRTDLYVLSSLELGLPFEITADILFGIVDVAVEVTPGFEGQLDAHVWNEDLTFGSERFICANLTVDLAAEVCVDAYPGAFGLAEVCRSWGPYEIVELPLIDPEGDDFRPSGRCDGSKIPPGACAEEGAGGALGRGAGADAFTPSWRVLSVTSTAVSPDGLTTIHCLVDEEGQARIAINDEPALASPLGGIVLVDPSAAFVSNDAALVAWTASFTSEAPDLATEGPLTEAEMLAQLNRVFTQKEIVITPVTRIAGTWVLWDAFRVADVSDGGPASTLSRRADGKADVAADLAAQDALVAWVRYETQDVLIQDTVQPMRTIRMPRDQSPTGCGSETLSFCDEEVANIRPQLELT